MRYQKSPFLRTRSSASTTLFFLLRIKSSPRRDHLGSADLTGINWVDSGSRNATTVFRPSAGLYMII
jgi:hypothetical protein